MATVLVLSHLATAQGRTRRVGLGLALLAAVTVAPLVACAGSDSDTPADVSRYCQRYRAYVLADARLADENDRDRVAAATEAAVRARAAMEGTTPPSLQDEVDTVRGYQLMSGQDRSVLENRLNYEMANDRIDAFRTDHCTLG